MDEITEKDKDAREWSMDYLWSSGQDDRGCSKSIKETKLCCVGVSREEKEKKTEIGR